MKKKSRNKTLDELNDMFNEATNALIFLDLMPDDDPLWESIHEYIDKASKEVKLFKAWYCK